MLHDDLPRRELPALHRRLHFRNRRLHHVERLRLGRGPAARRRKDGQQGAPRQDAPRQDAPRQDAPRQDAPRQDAARPDTRRPQSGPRGAGVGAWN
ncbi:MAG: hypothetical protein F4012_13315 [Gemmatimonadales bacterium]|nr:hypothetical protein [Gemmatimonadales bacterium]